MRSFLLCLAGLTLPAVAQAVAAEALPDPRPRSQVLDTTSTLTLDDLRAIDEAAARGASNGELMVVVVDSTGGVEPRVYATAVFNRFGPDTAERNRGVLLLAALKDKKAEIVIGDGFEGTVADVTERIMAEPVVAHFRRSDPRRAMVHGARALVDRVLLPPAAEAWGPGGGEALGPGGASTAARRKAPSGSALAESPGAWAAGGGIFLGAWLGVRRWLRRRPRKCRSCGQPMVRLDEAADDAHLAPAERTEEKLCSVDYDVWACPGCQATVKLRYGTLFTRYSRCGGCGAKTLLTTSRTLTPATESSTGTAEVTEDCEHCSHRCTSTRTIPRRPRPSSSSSGGFRSSGSSRGSSSGRGSSGSW